MIKINVDIFGDPNKAPDGSCGGCHKEGIAIKGKNEESKGCSNCQGCSGCSGENGKQTLIEQFKDLESFISKSDVASSINLRFHDINKINVLDYDNIRILTEMDYEAPFVVIDDLVRYYGAISKDLIYRDIKELLA